VDDHNRVDARWWKAAQIVVADLGPGSVDLNRMMDWLSRQDITGVNIRVRTDKVTSTTTGSTKRGPRGVGESIEESIARLVVGLNAQKSKEAHRD